MKAADNSSGAGPPNESGGSLSSTLLARVQTGESEGWRRLMDLYTPLVRWWCRRHGVRQPDSDDVVQEVFATAAVKVAGFRKDGAHGSFRRWLHAITFNKLRDHDRRQRKQVAAAGGSSAQQRLEQLPADADRDSSVSDDVSERRILVRRALKLIRVEFRPGTWEAVWQVVVEDRPVADVASGLGISVGAVYTAKSRALRRLREELADLLD